MPHISSNVVQIEAVQTVTPYLVTQPRQIWKVSVKDPIGSSIFKASLNIILFCNKEEGSGWHVAGWIKESLGRALKDEPLLSGRLRRGQNGHSDLEIVSDDSGVRLVEAKIDTTMQHFLALEDVKKAESRLVFWKDIDELNPQFSPLFYLQVTNFQCGGYSIGISCSILFADVLITDNFLQKWAKIHRDIVSRNNEAKVPVFYLPNLKPVHENLNGEFSSTTREKITQTVVYKISNTYEMVNLKENLALFCLEEAEKKFRIAKTSPEFGFLVKESPKVIKDRSWKKCEIGKFENDEVVILKTSDLNECMGMEEVYLREGSKPATVSYWISSGDDGVHAIVGPSYDKLGDSGDLNIIITMPIES
ncbi:3'-N-debenzoyl-2'-deoxytaxol N-benzoyltransferase-like [Euphorbia lathyris]|uniref:3'-N-debenzoyl-2'-deoxytaxol N-benzoyltransferase-like n=1 Tax=Euphorbia lathyris TaxID=212925 RepID=UPI0033130AE7